MSKKIKITDRAMVAGAKFVKPKFRTIFRPTTMSVGLAKAGAIPDVHLVAELCAYGMLKQKHDTENVRRSAFVPLCAS